MRSSKTRILTQAGSGTTTLSGANTNGGATSAAADLLVVSGDLNLSLDANDLSLLTFADIAGTTAPFAQDTTVFAMINYSGNRNNGLFSYNGNPLADGSRFFAGSQQWEIDYDYAYDTANPTTIQPLNFRIDHLPASGTQSFVTITAVPEPATLALIAAAALAYLTVRQPRRSPRAAGLCRCLPKCHWTTYPLPQAIEKPNPGPQASHVEAAELVVRPSTGGVADSLR